ncbi:MAG: FMN-binding negative transcriptional regulator [Gammaproteobacteria bacterium]|nr:FMN-binding negative transcriptional regulator [Gammaproteobacteria bacterium]
MYTPATFEMDLPGAQKLMRENGFATVVATHDGRMEATHLPIQYSPNGGRYGTLTGHFARSNPLGDAIANRETLVIFNGPHAYVSPSWYTQHPAVPTWNYQAVHAYGIAQLVHDSDALYDIVKDLCDTYEAAQPKPWQLESVTDQQFMSRMLDAIVGFHIVIDRLEAKSKISQNRSERDRSAVADALRDNPHTRPVSEAMDLDV